MRRKTGVDELDSGRGPRIAVRDRPTQRLDEDRRHDVLRRGVGEPGSRGLDPHDSVALDRRVAARAPESAADWRRASRKAQRARDIRDPHALAGSLRSLRDQRVKPFAKFGALGLAQMETVLRSTLENVFGVHRPFLGGENRASRS